MFDFSKMSNEEKFLHELGYLSRRFKVGISTQFKTRSLPPEQCGVFDHGYYDIKDNGHVAWHY